MILSIFIFTLTILLYLYILYQWKHSDVLEVFEMDIVDNHAHLQDACELRQPLLFSFNDRPLLAPPLAAMKHVDIAVRDVRDYCTTATATATLDPVEMSMERGLRFLEASPPFYFSEGNAAFVKESGLLRGGLTHESWLKPHFTVSSEYDVLFGAASVKTPFRYHTQSRRFLWAWQGASRVFLVPHRSMTNVVRDFEFYEFYSTDTTPPEKTVEVIVPEGHVLFVPAYWWYSIEVHDTSSRMLQCSYMTAMNVVAHSWDLARYWLQQQRITRNYIKSAKKIMGEGIGVDDNDAEPSSSTPPEPPSHHHHEEETAEHQQHQQLQQQPPTV